MEDSKNAHGSERGRQQAVSMMRFAKAMLRAARQVSSVTYASPSVAPLLLSFCVSHSMVHFHIFHGAQEHEMQ